METQRRFLQERKVEYEETKMGYSGVWSVCCFQWWNLLQKLKGEQIFYPELDQIRDMNGNLLLERKEFYICIYDDKEKVLDGQIGYTEYDFEQVILEGYAKTKRYEGCYRNGTIRAGSGDSF